MEAWVGYFTCPVCGRKTPIEDWRVEEGKELRIVFKAKTETREFELPITKITFECACGARWEFGIEPVRK